MKLFRFDGDKVFSKKPLSRLSVSIAVATWSAAVIVTSIPIFHDRPNLQNMISLSLVVLGLAVGEIVLKRSRDKADPFRSAANHSVEILDRIAEKEKSKTPDSLSVIQRVLADRGGSSLHVERAPDESNDRRV